MTMLTRDTACDIARGGGSGSGSKQHSSKAYSIALPRGGTGPPPPLSSPLLPCHAHDTSPLPLTLRSILFLLCSMLFCYALSCPARPPYRPA